MAHNQWHRGRAGSLRRRWLIVVVGAFSIGVAAIWFIAGYDRHDVSTGWASASTSRAANDVSGTTGELGGPPTSTLSTWITDIRSIGGLEDFAEHIGKQVRLVVASERVNDVAFWAGSPPDQLLAVISRDTRTAAERQRGEPSASGLASPPPGVITVTGTIESLPYPEATFSWGLTRRDVDVLAERGVYLRVTDILSSAPDLPNERLNADEIDEAGRETAPPPGDEVQTPLRVPPPLP